MSNKDSTLEVLLAEYNCLKSEQAQRIGFRDNLLYVTLGVFGAVVSFAVSDPSHSLRAAGDSLGLPDSGLDLRRQ